METDRHHRSNSNGNSSNSSSSSTSELFICFPSRLSSSSMKLTTSKSILSPGRACSRELSSSQISLSSSNSLSKRLRSSGSIKGSPMFATNAKKRAFENPEPSSPKVTCIGQVRVKTKKQGNKIRSCRSRRRSGEVSFRRSVDQNNNNNNNNNNVEQPSCNLPADYTHNRHQQQQQQRNQRWVHLPLTICEALRAFGAEFNCFLPCRSSCMANQKESKEDKAAESSNGKSCGAVFARWLVSVQDGEGKGREIELVVGGEEDEEEESTERRSYRRHVFEEFEFKEEKFEGGHEGIQEEEARVSFCIPPKNALLLMRCRSDPVRMAALGNKFWEAPARPQADNEEDEEGEDEQEKEERSGNVKEDQVGASTAEEEQRKEVAVEQKEDLTCEALVSNREDAEEHDDQIQEIEASPVVLEAEDGQEKSVEGNFVRQGEEEIQVLLELMSQLPALNETVGDAETSIYHGNEGKKNEMNPVGSPRPEQEEEQKDQEDTVSCSTDIQLQQQSEVVHDLLQDHKPEREAAESPSVPLSPETLKGGEETMMTHERSEPEDPKTQTAGLKSKEREISQPPVLPDCFLLMMCEPKLSMEVSKETWVRGTDFVRRLPEHSRPSVVNKTESEEESNKRISINKNAVPVHSNNLPLQQQPPRSSCSYPAKPPSRGGGSESMSTMIEQKLVGSKAYEPFVLKRCKSEPMRSAAKLAPESCFWKNRKLEPHCPATLGIGAAGVGF